MFHSLSLTLPFPPRDTAIRLAIPSLNPDEQTPPLAYTRKQQQQYGEHGFGESRGYRQSNESYAQQQQRHHQAVHRHLQQQEHQQGEGRGMESSWAGERGFGVGRVGGGRGGGRARHLMELLLSRDAAAARRVLLESVSYAPFRCGNVLQPVWVGDKPHDSVTTSCQ